LLERIILMHAAASLPAITPARAQPLESPLVLVNGVFEPRLTLTYATVDGPLDQRRLTLATNTTVSELTQNRWHHGELSVVLAQRLHDDAMHWPVLAQGDLQRIASHEQAGQIGHTFTLSDRWEMQLAQPPGPVPWVDAQGRLIAQPEGRLTLGDRANRSVEPYAIGDQMVYVLQQDGARWTVGQALATLSALAKLELILIGLPDSIAQAPLRMSLDLTERSENLLDALCQAHGLVIQRHMERVDGRLREQRVLRPLRHGRPIQTPWAMSDSSFSSVRAVNAQTPPDAARRWVAQSQPWVIESTFDLVPGWDPSLAGESDATYDRTASDNFSRYGNVYRQWVLNEDGAFSKPPYEQGEAFDLAAFFNDPRMAAQPLRLRPCITLDDAGQPLPPIVEVSTDAGSTWSRYGGEALVLATRAGVYLNDTTLPSALLSAAQAGEARVRVTASLRSPQPVTAQRWRGNPFAGQRPAKVLNVDEGFRFQKVAPASIHRAGIDAGQLQAAEVDQRLALQRWLLQRIQQAASAGDALDGEATLTVNGAWPWLKPGDRLLAAGGPHATLDGQPQATAERDAILTRFTVQFGIAYSQGPNTTLHLRY
jgi:hypothetical protein